MNRRTAARPVYFSSVSPTTSVGACRIPSRATSWLFSSASNTLKGMRASCSSFSACRQLGQVRVANSFTPPEPLLSTAMSKKDTIRISLNLSDEWAKVFDGASLMQGCLVVRTAWAKEHPAELARFLSDYEASIRFVNENLTEASLLIETYFGTAAAVAANKKFMPVFVSGLHNFVRAHDIGATFSEVGVARK